LKYHFAGAEKDELKDNIYTRLKYAGNMGTNLFSDNALVSIFTITKRAPQQVNNLVTSGLIFACANQMRSLDEEVVYQANRDIEL
jgi:type II secretory pathway predicted ATPase ExeA